MPDRPLALKVDENLPEDVAAMLRQAGQSGHGGQPRAFLVTLDVDFGDIRTYPPEAYPGMVVLRLTKQDKPNVLSAIRRMLPLLGSEPLARRLWVVEEHVVRIRGEA